MKQSHWGESRVAAKADSLASDNGSSVGMPSEATLGTRMPMLTWHSMGWACVAACLDLASTLLVTQMGASHGTAHLVGAFIGYALLAIRSVWATHDSERLWPSLLMIGIFTLLIRGGIVSTAIGMGTPGGLADLGGVVAGWSFVAAGRRFMDKSKDDPTAVPITLMSRSALAILTVAVLLRVVYIATLPLLAQETYYWNYAAHLDIGYFDHPPLVAWLIAMGQLLLGQTNAGIRLGSFACGLITIAFIYRFSLRLVDKASALMVAALVAALPFFFGAGMLATPDAPLVAAWAAALYFSHGALIMGNRAAWLGVGAAMGIGLLSKYTMALLGLSVFVFVLLDRRSWRWFLRWEPYAGVALAITVFTPVIVWNYRHDWASFLFQTQDRYGESSFGLHVLLMNMLLVATPIPLLAVPLLFMSRWLRQYQPIDEPELAKRQNRLFIACMVFVPMLVFVLNALRHEPRLNWTAPIWLALLPPAGWGILHAGSLRGKAWGSAFLWRKLRPLPLILLMLNAAVFYYVVLGLPGLPYPQSLARVIGWDTATRHIQDVSDGLVRATGQTPIVVGMDKYFTASKISYHAAKLRPDGFQAPMQVTSRGVVFGGNGLMFGYWDEPTRFSGRTFIMVARKKEELQSSELAKYFGQLEPGVHRIPLIQDGPGANNRFIAYYYYRVGYDYRPVEIDQ
jgi:dolichol-phosphate mannosyltransferase